MAYNRQPQVTLAGVGLKQNPTLATILPPGIVQVTLDVDTATTTSLGIVQVGSGLSITPSGVLSTTGDTDNKFVAVTLTDASYLITASDSYIGATINNITLTLPPGLLGRVYYIKNQSSGNIKVQGTGGETIDGAVFQTLGSNSGFMVVFDGARWNIL